jgi:CRISPR/Cas system CSM-associated protein Csm4 (group 5 of RAMP superfamily)
LNYRHISTHYFFPFPNSVFFSLTQNYKKKKKKRQMDPITQQEASSSLNINRATTIEEEVEEPTEPHTDSLTETEPLLVERSRHSFSYTANELRQRNVNSSTTTTIKETPTKTTTTTTHVIHDNYKDDHSYNGGGFYECNIW